MMLGRKLLHWKMMIIRDSISDPMLLKTAVRIDEYKLKGAINR